MVLVCLGLGTLSHAMADDWPQWLGPQRDGVWRESGILKKIPDNAAPKVRWKTPIHAGYSGPAVAEGRVYVMDFERAPDTAKPGNPFARGIVPGTERVVCLDDRNGKVIWSHAYPCDYTVSYGAGPRVTPAIDGGKVYTLGSEGHFFCLDAQSGKVIWTKSFGKEYGVKTPLWGFAGHPLVYKDMVICLVGGAGSVAVAFDKNTGQERWRALSAKEPGYCPPTLITFQGKQQLILWHPESINGLNPDTGKVLWTVPWKIRSALTISTPRIQGDRLFLTAFYNGATLLKLQSPPQEPAILWQTKKASEKDTTHLHSIMSTPVIDNDTIYGVCSYGQFRALNMASGDRLWEAMGLTTDQQRQARWANAFIVRHEERHFLFNERGELILVRLRPGGYDKLGRMTILPPTNTDVRSRKVLWSHPAFANQSVYARNDEAIIAVSLTAGE